MVNTNFCTIDKLTSAFYKTFGEYYRFFTHPKSKLLFCEYRFLEIILN